jgi:hypothetical protein
MKQNSVNQWRFRTPPTLAWPGGPLGRLVSLGCLILSKLVKFCLLAVFKTQAFHNGKFVEEPEQFD